MKISAAKFYRFDEITQIVHEVARKHPDLVQVTSIAKSPEGRDVWCVTVGRHDEGRPLDERPALLVVGNLHAIELAGSCCAMSLLGELTEGYIEGDSQVRRLLDEQVVYIVPRITVDATEFVLDTLCDVRSRAVDMKLEPNVLRPGDVNGDGRILTMRWPDENGRYVKSSHDERWMVPRTPESEGPFYQVMVEGFVHDWDGGPVRMQRPRIDFNRNFPTGWRVNRSEVTFGRYPLSEPETRGLADFILAHPTISRVVDLHTGNTAVFPPSGAVVANAKHPADAELTARLGKRAEELTGFPFVSGYTELATGRPEIPWPGCFKDWVYDHLGAYAIILELGDFHNFLGMSTAQYMRYPTAAEREEALGRILLAWHDRNPDAGLFFEWQPFDHPQLGSVEIGGLNQVDWRNPPLYEMEKVCADCNAFILEYAEYVPELAVVSSEVVPLADGLYKVSVELANTGTLATYISRQGLSTHFAEPPRVSLRAQGGKPEDVEFIIGRRLTSIDHLAPGGKRRLEWVVRAGDVSGLQLEVQSVSGASASVTLSLK